MALYNLIVALGGRIFLNKGYQCYLSMITNAGSRKASLVEILVVNDFENVFPK